MVEMVEEGVSGWLASGTGEEDLRAALAPLVAEPHRVRAVAGQPVRERRGELAEAADVVAAYEELCERGASRSVRGPRTTEPLVSVVIPYFRMHEFVGETLASVASQTHAAIETVLVNDGSLGPEDATAYELAERYGARVVTQPNAGLGAARNLGVAVTAGKYILPLDADNVLDPTFVEQALAALDAEPDAAYVTSWLRYIDEVGNPWKGTEEGLQPLGNSSAWVERYNVAGDATALFRREVFERFSYSRDLAGFEDWTLYREMRRANMLGHVIPAPLIGYRMRDESMIRTVSSPRERWLEQAIEAHLREQEVKWTAPAT
jgi:glycosyltransferase involved in cell wall biosynthesis